MQSDIQLKIEHKEYQLALEEYLIAKEKADGMLSDPAVMQWVLMIYGLLEFCYLLSKVAFFVTDQIALIDLSENLPFFFTTQNNPIKMHRLDLRSI